MWTAAVLLGYATVASAWQYAAKTPPLSTNWTSTVGTDPWTQYPRPQMVRDRWQSLNGVWSYKNATGGLQEVYNPPTGDLGNGVLIPSCLESALSGKYPSRSLFRCLRRRYTSISGNGPHILVPDHLQRPLSLAGRQYCRQLWCR